MILALLILLSFPVAAQEPPPGCGDLPPPPLKIAYTQQPRLNTPILDEPGRDPVHDMSNWQHWYDGGRPNRFTEADLVVDNLAGDKRVIWDCTTTDRICAAHDQRVSPDGKFLLFTVAYGDTLKPVKSAVANTPYSRKAVEFNASRYELWIHNIEEGKSELLESDARMGVWVQQWQVVFASCRAGEWPEWAYHGNDFQGDCSLQLYRGNISEEGGLKDIVNLTPHATMAMGPLVTSDGRLWYSDWWGYGEKGRGGTPANMYFVASMELNGTDWRIELNAHGSPTLYMRKYLAEVVDPARSGVGTTQLRLPRHLAELSKGKISVSNYYRSNHLGSNGAIFEWTPTGPPEGALMSQNVQESEYKRFSLGSGQFTPPDIVALTPYGTDSDNEHRFTKGGRLMGKAGTQHPTTMGYMLFTHIRGQGYEGTPSYQTFPGFTGGEPPAKKEIRIALVDKVTDPFDEQQSVTIACADLGLNCWDAVDIAPYSALYGQPAPNLAPPDLPPNYVSVLRVVDIKSGEIFPVPAYGDTNNAKVRLQGNADPDWQERIAGIRLYQITPWKKPADRVGFFKRKKLGDFYADETGRLEAVIPCNVVYQTVGLDKTGRELAWDTTKHFAQCGEIKTCHGCHDGHSVERWESLGKTPEERWLGD